MTLERIVLTFFERKPFVSLAIHPTPEEQFLALIQARHQLIGILEKLQLALDQFAAFHAQEDQWIGSLLTTHMASYEICLQKLETELQAFQNQMAYIRNTLPE